MKGHMMEPWVAETRRDFFTTTASGLGSLALASMLQRDGVLASEKSASSAPDALSLSHFAPKAKNCIFVFMAGAPSQIDLYDPKPQLKKLHGKPLPESFTKNVRFAFIKKETAVLMGSNRKFTPAGECGTEFSDLLPHLATCADDIALIRGMHTDAFNHHPGQLLLSTGSTRFGLPTIGSWLNYGLGSASDNLPGYVVLTAGRGSSGGTSLWSSGFLPSNYQGVLFRNKGEPVLNLANPAGIPDELQSASIRAITRANQRRYETVMDPEIKSRIASYELAFRMQAAAPELIDLSTESAATLESYGVHRTEGKLKGGRGGGKGTFASFATNCLLARRLVERGTRFVNIVHASWDHHSNLDNELTFNATMADQPVAALLKDLKQRGMLDSTLVIWGAEFGRTPLGENRNGRTSNTGRDHHPYAFSMWMAGGGIRGGQVMGTSDEFGWDVVEDRVHINDFHATLLHLFGVNHLNLTYRFQGRDFRLTDVAGKVIPRLLA